MNSIKNIFISVFAVFYLLVSTGLVLVDSACTCTDEYCCTTTENQGREDADAGSCCSDIAINVAVTPENYRQDACSCNEPVINYIKLSNHFGDDIVTKLVHQSLPFIGLIPEIEFLDGYYSVCFESHRETYSPPENPLFGRNLLNFLHQRKISIPV